jgi:hypothetical protein
MDGGIGGPILALLGLFIRAVGGSGEFPQFSETDKQFALTESRIGLHQILTWPIWMVGCVLV